ncbi:MAG: iron-containing redox enzyme family protein [Pseudomonadota bacterium]
MPKDSDRPASALVRDRLELFHGVLGTEFARVWAHPDQARVYPAFMTMVYRIIRASVPLMAAAQAEAARRAQAAGGDPLCTMLAEYFAEHCVEERDHDIWTLEDLAAIGADAGAIAAQMPAPEIAAMAGAQYYWIHHHHPVCLLGYIAVLEGRPPSPEHIDRVQARTGLPDAAFRTYRYHAVVDQTHRDDLDALIDRLPLTGRELGWIGVSAIQTIAAYRICVQRMLDGLGPAG